jgi:hypothetical protein
MSLHLTLIAIPLSALVVFLLLVTYEERRGNRLVLSGRRYLLDKRTTRLAFVIRHVDWGAFLWDLTRTSMERIAHDLAHSTLIGVRFLERQLALAVRTLRARRDEPVLPARNADKPSRLESAVSAVKKTVQRSRKQPKRAVVVQETEEGEV